MYRALASIALAGVVVLLGGCDDPTAPNRNAALARAASSDVPSALRGGPASETQIDLFWEDNSRNESGFEIYRSTTGATGTFGSLVRTAANVTTYSNTGLTPSTEYCYKVRWFRSQGKGSTSAFSDPPHCVRTLGKPPAPTSVAAIPGAFYNVWIDISWVESSGTAGGFRVERSVAAGPWEPIADLPYYWARTFRDENRAIEVQACYRVFASNTFGSSPASTVTCTTPPAKPTELKAAAASAQSIALSWQPSTFADGYEVQRSIDASFWSVVATLPKTATSHVDAGLTTGTWYYYQVRARKDGGFSAFTPVVRALAAGSPPASSPTIDAVAVGSSRVKISWTAPTSSAEGYRVERTTADGTTLSTVETVGAFQDSIVDNGRTVGERVCYKLIAFNGIGDAPASNVDCVTPPPAVSNLGATPGGNGSVVLAWTKPSTLVTGYELEYLQTLPDYSWYCQYYGVCYPSQEWVELPPPLGDVTSHTVLGLGQYEQHSFRLRALSADGTSDPSAAAESYTEPSPDPPSGLSATAISSSRVDLGWADNSSDETSFSVDRCEGTAQACGSDGFVPYAGFAANTIELSDTEVQAGVTYTYRVVAWNYGSPSAPSNTVTVTVPAAPPE